jgi:phenylalanyl-tRNA synthetase beta chain
VTIPGFRADVSVEADLIEEIARMKGLDAIPALMQPCLPSGSFADSHSWRREEVRNQLVGLGLTETVNYSFMSEKLAGLMNESYGVPLPNPVSADYCVMRGSLAPQMIDMLGRNLARQNHDCACFEIGKVFIGKGADIREEERICVGLMGRPGRYSLDKVRKAGNEEVFLWLKGIVEALASMNGRTVALKPFACSLLEDGAAAGIWIGENLTGWMGILSGGIRGDYRMMDPVAVAELDLGSVLQTPSRERGIKPLPAYPAVSRDIAVIVNESVLHEDILEVVKAVKCPELTRISLFDIFRGKGTGDGRKSMAYSFTFQASDRTLTDDEANGFRDRIRDGIVSKLNAEIREG